MINFACVYRTGKIYNPEYVHRLAKAVGDYYPAEHTFTVLTDDPISIASFMRLDYARQFRNVVPLKNDWPGYWSKIELFRPDVFPFGSFVVYLDLDTIPRDFIGFFSALRAGITPFKFYMLRDWLAPDHYNSSVMCWTAGYFDHIYRIFVADGPDSFMKEYRTYPERWGDQSFISDSLGFRPDRLQDELPGHFASFKASSLEDKKNASVVCFHGNPRPHQVNWNPVAPFPGV